MVPPEGSMMALPRITGRVVPAGRMARTDRQAPGLAI